MSWSSCATSTFGSGSTSKPSTCRRTCSTSSGSWTAVPGQSSRSGTATSCSAVLCCAVAVRVCDVTSPSVFPYAPSPLGSQRTPHTQQAHVAHAIVPRCSARGLRQLLDDSGAWCATSHTLPFRHHGHAWCLRRCPARRFQQTISRDAALSVPHSLVLATLPA